MQWISVKERLPDKTCDCLIYIPDSYNTICDEGVQLGSYVYRTGVRTRKQNGFYVVSLWGCDYDTEEATELVTHWMPLPDKPELL